MRNNWYIAVVISLVTVSRGSRGSYSAWIERWRLRAMQFDDLEEVDVVITEISNIGSNKIRTIFDSNEINFIPYHEHFLFYFILFISFIWKIGVLCCSERK